MRRGVAELAHQHASDPACAPGRKIPPVTPEPKQRITDMEKSAKSRAEIKFAATQKRDQQFLNEKEKAQQELVERVAKLRALRLAKEAADKEAAEQAAAEKKKPLRSAKG
jgi:colicin import membrane protein